MHVQDLVISPTVQSHQGKNPTSIEVGAVLVYRVNRVA